MHSLRFNARSATYSGSHWMVLAVLILTLADCGGGSVIQPPPPPAPDFGITANSQSLTITEGGSTTVQVSITALNGFTGSVSVAISGLPSGVNASPTSP